MTNSIRNNISLFRSLWHTKEGLYILFLTLVWGSGILRFLKFIVAHNSVTEFLEPYFHVLLLLLFSVIIIKQIMSHLQSRDLFFCIICLIVFFSYFLLYPSNIDALMQYIYVFPIFTLPFFLWGIQMDIENLDTYFKPISYLNILLYFVYSLFYLQRKFPPGTLDGEYYMREAYVVLPYIIYAIWCALREHSILDILISLLGIFLLFSYGTRGPIVCLIAFIMLYVILIAKSKYKLPLVVGMIACVGIVAMNVDAILSFFIELMPKIGMSNRVFMSMADNAFINYENSSNRDIIIEQLWGALKVSEPFGYGLCGSWNICGGYAHNFILDILISFGIPIGSIFILATLLLFLKGFLSCSSDNEKGFFLILICSGFLKLFISNFFLRESLFWLLIGYCIFLIRKQRALKKDD